MRACRTFACFGLALLGVLALTVPAGARADDPDPPGRAARLGYLEGAVSLEPAGTQDWTPAERNRPLTTGDRLWTDQDAVAELDVGSAVVRLGAMTGFAFLNLDDSHAQMQLSAGVIIVRVWDLSQGQNYEIDTPNLALALQQPGVYRIEVDESGGTTTIKVSEGEALAIGSDQSIPITTQQVMTFAGTSTLSYSAATLGGPDDFDTWSAARDNQEEQSPSWQYVADDTPGGVSLDDNGRWMDTPQYGPVWTPVVAVAGWVPYRFGHWAWVGPWGWTWIDDAPWGYTPFHYGRWVFWEGSWCWVPGPRGSRPVFAPALVAWTGGLPPPPGSIARSVGWFPLGPREVYAPAYPVSNAYLLRVNRANTTITSETYVTNVYQKQVTNVRYVNGTTSAVTTVPQNVFTSAQGVAKHTLPVTAGALAAMTVVAAAPSIAPSHQSVLGAATGAKGHPPPALVNRPVVAHTPPPRAPVSFDRQLAAIQANGGRPLAPGELERLQPGAPTAEVHMLPGRPSHVETQPQPLPSLGDRARALESPSIPPATTTTRTFVGEATPAPMPTQTPAPRTDRPPYASPRSYSTEGASHPTGLPPAISVYHNDNPSPQIEVKPVPVPAEPGGERTPRTPSSNTSVPPRLQPPAQPQKAESRPQATKKESREEPGPKTDKTREKGDR
ncbi:MAG TPA: DUF6600 domain-containing protein [Gemmatimonadales bacterium]|nr:DUF6600 domain-containing protein [Gemmatimonadales bacterium]